MTHTSAMQMRVTCYKHTLRDDDDDEGNNDSDNDTLPPTTAATTTATFKQRHDHHVRALDEGKRQQPAASSNQGWAKYVDF